MGAGASTLEGVDKAKLETLQTELSKPVDLSDLAEGTDAKEEVKKIRALFIESGLDKVGSDEIKAEAGKQADCADVTDDGKAELTRLRGLLAAMKAKADATTTETTTEPTTTETTGDANVVEEITVQQLLEKVDEAILTHKKWPLFLDSNDSKPVAAFLGYQQNMTIDAKKGMVESSIKKTKSIEEVQEEWRQLASKSLIAKSQPTAGFQGAGCPLWLHMGASATDFKGKYSAEGSKFPIDIFSCEKMATEESKQKFVTEEEKGPVDLWGKDFKVILTSDFELEDYKEFLENSIPLEQLKVCFLLYYLLYLFISIDLNRE
tara:strand:- start:2924 stop:3883 length:960 start_codon:yes stop_codon:yes gene_type:complete